MMNIAFKRLARIGFARQELTGLALGCLLLMPFLPVVGIVQGLLPVAGIVLLVGLLGLGGGRVRWTVPVLGVLAYSAFLVVHLCVLHPVAAQAGSVLALLLGQAILLLVMLQIRLSLRLLYGFAQVALLAMVGYVLPIYFLEYGLWDLPTIGFGMVGGTSAVAQATCLLLLLVLLLRQLGGFRTWPGLVIAGLGLGLLLLLKSRTGVLGIGAYALVAYLPWLLKRKALLLILAAVPLLYFLKPASVNGRFQLWNYALQHLNTEALTGAGIGNFGGFYHQAILLDVQAGQYAEADIAAIGEVNQLAFNDFVQVLIEQGLIGLCLIFLPLGFLIYQTWRRKAPLTIAGAGLGSAVLLFSLFPLHAMATLPMLFLLWGICLHELLQYAPAASVFPSFQNLRLSHAWTLPLLMTLFGFSFSQHKLNTEWRAATLKLPAPGRNDPKIAAAYADLLPELQHTTGFRYEYGKLHAHAGQHMLALPHFQAAAALQPSYAHLLSLADACEIIGDLRAAHVHYQCAAYLRPFTLYPKYRCFLLDWQAGNLERGQILGNEILQMEVRGNAELGERIKNDVQQRMDRLVLDQNPMDTSTPAPQR